MRRRTGNLDRRFGGFSLPLDARFVDEGRRHSNSQIRKMDGNIKGERIVLHNGTMAEVTSVNEESSVFDLMICVNKETESNLFDRC